MKISLKGEAFKARFMKILFVTSEVATVFKLRIGDVSYALPAALKRLSQDRDRPPILSESETQDGQVCGTARRFVGRQA